MTAAGLRIHLEAAVATLDLLTKVANHWRNESHDCSSLGPALSQSLSGDIDGAPMTDWSEVFFVLRQLHCDAHVCPVNPLDSQIQGMKHPGEPPSKPAHQVPTVNPTSKANNGMSQVR